MQMKMGSSSKASVLFSSGTNFIEMFRSAAEILTAESLGARVGAKKQVVLVTDGELPPIVSKKVGFLVDARYGQAGCFASTIAELTSCYTAAAERELLGLQAMVRFASSSSSPPTTIIPSSFLP